VYQASGYGEIAQNQSMFFWFFEARENPDNAPLTLWLNGGVCPYTNSPRLVLTATCLFF
jgi:carboxypeptidase C (cathepsin A)